MHGAKQKKPVWGETCQVKDNSGDSDKAGGCQNHRWKENSTGWSLRMFRAVRPLHTTQSQLMSADQYPSFPTHRMFRAKNEFKALYPLSILL